MCFGSEAHFGGHVLTMLLCGVDQSLVQIHHENQLPVPVEPLLVFSTELLCLLGTKHTHTSVQATQITAMILPFPVLRLSL